MLKRIIRKCFSLLGLRITRANKAKDATAGSFSPEYVPLLEWLKDYNIATILDIGANEGQFALMIKNVLPGAELHCFEPLPYVFDKLVDKFKSNDKVVLHNFGLGEANEEQLIHNNEYSPSSSLLEMLDLHKSNFDFAIKTENLRIKIRRLDDFFKTPPEGPLLVKIDVQGYEMKVLQGGERTVALADAVIIETSFVRLYKDQPLFADIYHYFISRGFQYAGNMDQLVSPKNNQILQADALFLKKKDN